jgi:hypothetical protein
MDRVFDALQQLREVNSVLLSKEKEFHAAVRSNDDETMRRLRVELAEIFTQSDAAIAALQVALKRVEEKPLRPVQR